MGADLFFVNRPATAWLVIGRDPRAQFQRWLTRSDCDGFDVGIAVEHPLSEQADAAPGNAVAAEVEGLGRDHGETEARLTNESGEVLATASSTAKLVPTKQEVPYARS